MTFNEQRRRCGGVGGTPAPSPVRGRRGGGGAGPAGRAGPRRPRPGKFLGVFRVLAPLAAPASVAAGMGRGCPGTRPPPPPARDLPRTPPRCVPSPRVVSPRNFFLGWLRGLFAVAGRSSECLQCPPPVLYPRTGVPPKPGARVGGEGPAQPRLPALPCARAGGCPRLARGPPVTPSPATAGGCEWAGVMAPQPGEGAPLEAPQQPGHSRTRTPAPSRVPKCGKGSQRGLGPRRSLGQVWGRSCLLGAAAGSWE